MERFVFFRRGIVKYFEEIKSDYVDMSNVKYSVNLHHRKPKGFLRYVRHRRVIQSLRIKMKILFDGY